MTARGPLFVTPAAVRKYLALSRPGADPEDDDTFAAADAELMAIVAQAHPVISPDGAPKRTRQGLAVWRGQKPQRLQLLVAAPQARGDLPALVDVAPAHDGLRSGAAAQALQAPAHARASSRSAIPLGRPVAALRARSGLSVIQLAERMGVTRDAVYQAEERGSGVTLEYLQRVARACRLLLRIDAG